MIIRKTLKAERLQFQRAIKLEEKDFLEPTKLKLLRQYTRRLKKINQDLKRYYNE